MIVDLFAGVGWALGLRSLGLTEVGFDMEPTVCTVRAANGMLTVRQDVRTISPERWDGVEGVLASPPCQSFSRQGNRAGLNDARGQLVWEPLRIVLACRPEWTVWEQVPDVLDIWRRCAVDLRAAGYSVWAGVLSAEQYGVPQTRERAFLVASRVRPALPPEPSHAAFRAVREPALFGPELLPTPVIGDVLDAAPGSRMFLHRGFGGQVYRAMTEPASTLMATRNAEWLHDDGSQTPFTVRDLRLLQGFPDWFDMPLNQTASERVIGNSVCPAVAAAAVKTVRGEG